jgi:hypothetical protein
MNLRLSFGVYITTRNSKSAGLMKKQGMRDKVKSTAKIEINGITLTLGAN